MSCGVAASACKCFCTTSAASSSRQHSSARLPASCPPTQVPMWLILHSQAGGYDAFSLAHVGFRSRGGSWSGPCCSGHRERVSPGERSQSWFVETQRGEVYIQSRSATPKWHAENRGSRSGGESHRRWNQRGGNTH